MKVHWLALLLVIGTALTVPVVSAKIVEEKDGYVVTPGDNTLRLPEISRLSSASISQGQTQWYSTSVSPGKPRSLPICTGAILQIPSHSRLLLLVPHSVPTMIQRTGELMAGLT